MFAVLSTGVDEQPAISQAVAQMASQTGAADNLARNFI